MIHHKIHKIHIIHENAYNFIIYFTYFLYFAIALGISAAAPKYLDLVNYYTKIYVSIFLILRFNPFTRIKFTRLDKKIAFNAGIFVLLSTFPIYQTAMNYLTNIKKKV
jgi:hypothetical protein